MARDGGRARKRKSGLGLCGNHWTSSEFSPRQCWRSRYSRRALNRNAANWRLSQATTFSLTELMVCASYARVAHVLGNCFNLRLFVYAPRSSFTWGSHLFGGCRTRRKSGTSVPTEQPVFRRVEDTTERLRIHP